MIIIAKNKKKDTQSRDYLIVINNPKKHNLTWEKAIEIIKKFKPTYYCISHEVGAKGTPHYHIYWRSQSPARFSTVISKSRFYMCHAETEIKGKPSECRAYVLKIEKWKNTEKAETQIKSFEWGEIPISVKEKHNKEKLLEDIKAGKTNIEIIEENPSFAFRIREIDTIRHNYLKEKSSKSFRKIKTYFCYGETATGKSTWVYENFPPQDIFRVYNYHNLNAMWDGYDGEKVVFMDEITNVPIELMLIITDKFPLSSGLSNRYNNVIPNFDVLVVATNTKYENMYAYEKVMKPSTWKAYDRRWGNIFEFKKTPENKYEIIKHRETKYEEELS